MSAPSISVTLPAASALILHAGLVAARDALIADGADTYHNTDYSGPPQDLHNIEELLSDWNGAVEAYFALEVNPAGDRTLRPVDYHAAAVLTRIFTVVEGHARGIVNDFMCSPGGYVVGMDTAHLAHQVLEEAGPLIVEIERQACINKAWYEALPAMDPNDIPY